MFMQLRKINILVKDVIYQDEGTEIINFQENSYKIELDIHQIEESFKNNITKNFHLSLHDHQSIIELKIFFPENKKIESYMKEVALVKNIIFSFILSIKDFKIVYGREHEQYEMGFTEGVGVGLPFCILRFNDRGDTVNAVYANDITKMQFLNDFYVVYEPININIMRQILEKVVMGENITISEFIKESFSMIHTINWVVPGMFYPASIIQFSCFESLLGKKTGEQIKDLIIAKGISLSPSQQNDLESFQKFRNAIAHPSTHEIILKNNIYEVYDMKGELETEFDIHKLDGVRKILVKLIFTILGI